MKKLATVIIALTLPLTACGSNAKYEEGAEYLTQHGYPMDAETFKTFADTTCDNIESSEGTRGKAMEESSKTLQLLGMNKAKADMIVGVSAADICP